MNKSLEQVAFDAVREHVILPDDQTLDIARKIVAAVAPASGDVERVAEALIAELKRQNLAEDKDVGRTEYRLFLGVSEGIIDIKQLAKAALTTPATVPPQDSTGIKTGQISVSAIPVPPQGDVEKLGRFGHHPDPAIDFCTEVDAIEGLVYEVKCGLADKEAVSKRIFTAMMFRVGGDEGAVKAKARLRELEQEIDAATVPDAAPSPNKPETCDSCGVSEGRWHSAGCHVAPVSRFMGTAPSPDCRDAFEKDLTQEQKKRHPQLDHYIDSVVDAQWLGWQARGEYEAARIRDSIAKGDTRCSDCPCRYGHHCARTPTPPITPEQREAATLPQRPVDGGGRERLWRWFGLSYASFLTMPRVLLHEMPDEWQGKLAALLEQYDDAFPNQPDIGITCRAERAGKLVPMPAWIINYRYPDQEEISKLRQEGHQL